jgi:hypothetical protein
MPHIPEADERRAYIESIISVLGPARVSRENAERNLGVLDLESLAQLSSRICDTKERANAIVNSWRVNAEGESQQQGQSNGSPAAKGSLGEMLFQLRAERTQTSVQDSELSYASRVARLLKRIGSQGNDQDLLRCHRRESYYKNGSNNILHILHHRLTVVVFFLGYELNGYGERRKLLRRACARLAEGPRGA